MGFFKEFRDFAMKGNVVDLAVGVIIGASFGGLVKSLVDDVLMPPIGKIVGNLDFSNLYVSISDKVDAANTSKAHVIAATQPTTNSIIGGPVGGAVGNVMSAFDTTVRLPLADAKKLGPVIAYGDFLTGVINFVIIALCVFVVIKLMNSMARRFEKEQAASPPPLSTETILLTEIRDLLKSGR